MKLSAEREQYRKLYMDLLERCKLLEKGIVVGKKAERFTAGEDPQLALQILETLLAGRDVVEEVEEEVELDDDDDDDGTDDAEKGRREPARRRSRGRRPLPENLPRVEIEVLPPEVVREGLDAFERIGQVVSEVVERRPASLVVTRIVRPKFVRKGEAPGAIDDEAPEVPTVQIAECPEPSVRTRAPARFSPDPLLWGVRKSPSPPCSHHSALRRPGARAAARPRRRRRERRLR